MSRPKEDRNKLKLEDLVEMLSQERLRNRELEEREIELMRKNLRQKEKIDCFIEAMGEFIVKKSSHKRSDGK